MDIKKECVFVAPKRIKRKAGNQIVIIPLPDSLTAAKIAEVIKEAIRNKTCGIRSALKGA